jgi:hypothetical protein
MLGDVNRQAEPDRSPRVVCDLLARVVISISTNIETLPQPDGMQG